LTADSKNERGDPKAERDLWHVLSDATASVADRRKALRRLVGVATDASVPVLAKALNDPDTGVRMRALKVLGAVGTESAVNTLIAAVGSTDRDVVVRAAKYLGEARAKEAVSSLIDALEHPTVRLGPTDQFFLIRAMAEIADERAVPILTEYARSVDSDARRRAREGLVEINLPASRRALDLLGAEDAETKWWSVVGGRRQKGRRPGWPLYPEGTPIPPVTDWLLRARHYVGELFWWLTSSW
jgi:HEAT repeat protein